MTAPASGTGECRVCRGLALYRPVPDGPWWTHDEPSADHRVLIDPDTTSYGADGVRLPGAESAAADLRRAEEDLVKADAAGVLLAAQLRAAKIDVEAWKANANTHLAECLRLEKLVIARTRERDEARRSWVVARDGGRDCGACRREIRRGEAYEFVDPDNLRHIHCPDREAEATGQELDEARKLLGYAFHLRQHGERAPGGEETWAQFDRDAEAFLRKGATDG